MLQFDAMPLAWSSRSGLLQEYGIHSPCPRAAIVRAKRFFLPHCARGSGGTSPVRSLRLFLTCDCGGSSRASILRLSSTPASAYLVLPLVGPPAFANVCSDNAYFSLEEKV